MRTFFSKRIGLGTAAFVLVLTLVGFGLFPRSGRRVTLLNQGFRVLTARSSYGTSHKLFFARWPEGELREQFHSWGLKVQRSGGVQLGSGKASYAFMLRYTGQLTRNELDHPTTDPPPEALPDLPGNRLEPAGDVHRSLHRHRGYRKDALRHRSLYRRLPLPPGTGAAAEPLLRGALQPGQQRPRRPGLQGFHPPPSRRHPRLAHPGHVLHPRRQPHRPRLRRQSDRDRTRPPRSQNFLLGICPRRCSPDHSHHGRRNPAAALSGKSGTDDRFLSSVGCRTLTGNDRPQDRWPVPPAS